MRVLRLLSALVVGAGILAGSARGQEPPASEAQIQRIRQLPAGEKHRLKAALRRFSELPAAEREALRLKAREIGAERLGELAGRDFEKIRARHVFLQREMEELAKLLGGPARIESLAPEERAFVRAEAIRGFQWHCRTRMLEAAGLAAGFDQLGRAERRDRMGKAAAAAIQRILAEKTPDERARHLALPLPEMSRERAEMLAEWRLRETVPFAKKFEGARLLPLLQKTPEERRAILGRRVRWFQLTSRLAADGAPPETLRMLHRLRCDERAQVSQVFEQSIDLPAPDRRARVEAKIRELDGRSALDSERTQRPLPRLRELLRERRGAEAEETAPR